jgi:hypothetical protein
VIWVMAHTTVVGKEILDVPAVVRPVRRAQPVVPAPVAAPVSAPVSKWRSFPGPVAA